ncbi:MAG: hypothetical protein QOD33_1208, partial [Pyrinomonadaceae bacterium]|nr:hypothetical protein [Pyrinomonadaceae bacterium]
MLTETFRAIISATRKVFSNWRALVLLAVVYASLLAVLYSFIAVREASLGQVILTFVLALLAPVLFFLLQSMVASQTEDASGASLFRRSLSTWWKVVLISLPLIALAILIAYLLAKVQNHFGAAAVTPRPLAETMNSPHVAPPINWRIALLSTVRYLAFGLVLPLAAIHLWLATARVGLGATLRGVGTHLANAFAPRSVLTYLAGFLVFGVVPYLLLFKTTQTSHAWLELTMLIARLAIVFALTLLGWLITVRALS